LISIQSGMLVALGFLAASFIALLLASAFWSRAVRLTTARIKQSLPVSEREIRADRDRLRAEYAIKVHKLETQLEQAKVARVRQLVELNRRDASISTLETDVGRIRGELEEHQNARHVLEQTVADRLPKVEARLSEAKRLIHNREREIGELKEGARRHKLALEEAAAINAQQTAHIDRLTSTMAARGGERKPGADGAGDAEAALRGELEAVRSKARDQANLIDRLQRGAHDAPAAATGNGVPPPASEEPRELLAQAERTLNAVRTGSADDTKSASATSELRQLKAKAEDQAGEITRLRAALTAFEADGEAAGGSKETRIALKARLGSAQAQAEHQSAVIGRLRAELAAANERLARQAAQFMDEMRRIGAGSTPIATQPRPAARAERRPLAERVAQVRSQPAAVPQGAKAAAAEARAADPPINGAEEPNPAAAAEMPKAGDISLEPRRLRLLDRITNLAKE